MTRELTEAEWLDLRRDSVGASEAAAACGESKYCSALRLWAEKLDLQPREQMDTFATRRGRALEGFVLDEYARHTGYRLLPTETEADRAEFERRVTENGACEVVGWLKANGRPQAFLRSKRWLWMTATLDGLAEKPDGSLETVEAKSVGFHAAREWGEAESEMSPTIYRFQALHQIAVTGLASGALIAVIGADDPRIVTEHAERPSIDIPSIVALEGSFARCLRDRVAPDWDSVAASDARKTRVKLHPDDSGRTAILSEAVLGIHRELQEARSERLKIEKLAKAIKEREEAIATRIEALLDGATYGTLPDGSGEYVRKTVSRAGYSVGPTTYPQLTFKESGK